VTGTTDIGAEFGDVRPLDKARVHAMSVNGVHLLDLIDSNDAFITELASPEVGCITWSQRQHIIDVVESRDRSQELLDLLTRGSVASFKQFITVVSKYQAHLVPLLVTDGGETLYFPVVSFYLLLLLFSSPNLSGRRLDVYHTLTRHMVWP